VAALLGLNPATLQNWRRNGCPYQEINGTVHYVLPLVWQWRMEREREAGAPKDEAEAQRRKLNAEAQLAELKLETERRRVAPVEDMLATVDGVFGTVRALLLAFPQRVAPDLVGVKGIPAVTQKLRAAIEDILTELST
jgi:phage terminase Nu1 subunit (DNA packaging protein)